ncbi:MAG: HAMP domain-containing sensor histidine kinase, partial [Bacteroidota bacterium]
MSQKTIYLIIGLIVVSLLGVLLLQLNLIQRGMEVNAQRYDEAIQDALKSAARELEEKEATMINLSTSSGYADPKANSSLQPSEFGQNIQYAKILRSGLPITKSFSDRLYLQAQLASKDLIDRIDESNGRDFLDKKLKSEFTDADLGNDLEYGIYDNRQHLFILRNGRKLSEVGSDTSRHLDLLHSSYRVSLYDEEIGSHGYLMAYSPRKDEVIFSSIWGNLAASILFVGIILGCFAYTIYIILFQKKVSEMKTDFINNMTHEFKTPIATISLATDSIISPKISANPEKVKRFANIIKQENKRMNNQVEKVLQMAKLDKSKLNLNLTAVDLNQVVTEAVEYISLPVEPRGGTVTTDLRATPSVVEGDMTHLASLVNNLLD